MGVTVRRTVRMHVTVIVGVGDQPKPLEMDMRTCIVVTGLCVPRRPVRMRRKCQLGGQMNRDQQTGSAAANHNGFGDLP